jgi:ligand-binding sensor domain-containing protein
LFDAGSASQPSCPYCASTLAPASLALSDYHIEPDGQLWLATNRGLQHYDGLQWTTWTTADGLPSDEVSGVALGTDGAFGSAVSRFDGDTWVSLHLPPEQRGLPVNVMHATGDGALWLTTAAGVLRYHNGDWRHFDQADTAPNTATVGVLEAADGDL